MKERQATRNSSGCLVINNKITYIIACWYKFFIGECGAIAISFLLMLPIILSFLALAIDGSRLMMKKNRLYRVLNESALAISANRITDETLSEDEKIEINRTLLKDYLEAHLIGDELKEYDVITNTTTADDGSTITYYTLQAVLNIKTFLPLDGLPSFEPVIELSNYGKVKLQTETGGLPADYAFVLDFSGSMTNQVSSSSGVNMTRIALLKQVLNDVIPQAINDNKNTQIALLPYDVGVPELLSGTNPAGGDRIGCTFQNKSLNEKYNIDYSFWSKMFAFAVSTYDAESDTYKPVSYTGLTALPTVTFKASNGYSKEVMTLDYFRYEYYHNYVAVATGYSFDDMIKLGWCVDNQGTEYGKIVPYSCAQSYEIRVNSAEGVALVAKEYDKFKYLLENAVHLPTASFKNVDAEAIIEHLFDDDSDSLATFEREWSPKGSATHPKYNDKYLCLLSGYGTYEYDLNNYIAVKSMVSLTKEKMPSVEIKSYLIDLTHDIDKLNKFNGMAPMKGETDSNTALLRAAQVLKKGTNPRKVIIVISDGEDSYSEQTEIYHSTLKVCSKIREGLLKYSSGTEKVDFYFIATVDNLDSTMTLWADNCTDLELDANDESHTMLATNYSELTSALHSIMEKPSEVGVFYVD